MMHEACSASDVNDRRGKRVTVAGEDLVLFFAEGKICAVANFCPHQHFRKLHEGMFDNGIVTCPMHGWAYDVRTGISTNASGRLRTFPATVMNGKIMVEME